MFKCKKWMSKRASESISKVHFHFNEYPETEYSFKGIQLAHLFETKTVIC